MKTVKRMVLPVRGLLLPVLLAAVLPVGQALAVSFTYNDFSSVAGLTLNGNAAQSGSVLRVVPNVDTQSGTAFRTTAVPLSYNTAFSTAFKFLVTTDAGDPTDGFTFLLQNDAAGATALGAGGQGMGYVGVSPSVAVCFRGRAPSFIGVITGGQDPSTLSNPFNPPGSVSMTEGAFYNQDEFVWIDYNPTNTLLSLYLNSTSVKPVSPTMSTTVDISGELGSQAFVGFSAGNGGAFGNQDILNWTFTSSVPEPGTAALIGTGLAALIFPRRRRKR